MECLAKITPLKLVSSEAKEQDESGNNGFDAPVVGNGNEKSGTGNQCTEVENVLEDLKQDVTQADDVRVVTSCLLATTNNAIAISEKDKLSSTFREFRDVVASDTDEDDGGDEDGESFSPKGVPSSQFQQANENLLCVIPSSQHQMSGSPDSSDQQGDTTIEDDCDEDDGLPLKGTVIFVDVRAENENRSKAISNEVEKLGSVVVTKISNIVTHVVYKDGRNNTLCQVKKYPDIHLVSVLWVDACKTTLTRADEGLYAVKFSDAECSPFPAKVRRVKSLQPKSVDEDVNNSGKKNERRRKRLKDQGKSTGDTPPDNIICMDSADEYIKSSDLYRLVATPRIVPDTPWILKYINSSNPTGDSNSEISTDKTSELDGSFTSVIARSPNQRTNVSLLSTLPRRLSKDLVEPEESFVMVTPEKYNAAKDSTINYSVAPAEKPGPSKVSMENTAIEDDVFVKADLPQVGEKTPERVKQKIPLQTDFSELRISDAAGKERDVLNDISAAVKNCTLLQRKPRKMKKLLSHTDLLPYADSPTEGDNDNITNLPMPAFYPKKLPKGGVLNPNLVMTNVETSKISKARQLKLKQQKKYLLRPFCSQEVDSPNSSFKTKDTLQLRPPNRKRAQTEVDYAEDETEEEMDKKNLVEDMTNMRVDPNSSFEEEIDFKRDVAVTPVSRRSSGADFKVGKKLRNPSLRTKIQRKDPNKIREDTTSLLRDGGTKTGSTAVPRMFSSSEESDEESVDSNISFIHDEEKGLIILSQSQDENPIPHNDVDMRRDMKDDSGISDGDDLPDVENIDPSRRKPQRKLTTERKRGGGKLPKASTSSIRTSRIVVSPYSKSRTKSSLVSTSLHFSEQTFLKAMLKKLGGFTYKVNVANDTTHIVAGSERRTLNVLFGMAYGCWVLNPKWVSDSAEQGKWLGETDYEMQEEFPMAKESRLSRVENGRSFLSTLFISAPPIYVSDATSPPSHELVKLVSLCGGRVTNSVRKAGIGVGVVSTRRTDLCMVTEKWVLDCLTAGHLVPTKEYEREAVRNVTGSPGF